MFWTLFGKSFTWCFSVFEEVALFADFLVVICFRSLMCQFLCEVLLVVNIVYSNS